MDNQNYNQMPTKQGGAGLAIASMVLGIIALVFSTPILKNIYNKVIKSDILNTFILMSIFLVSIAYLVDATYNPFLYFRF